MPCDQIILMKVTFKVESTDTLKKAVAKVGWTLKEYAGGMAVYNKSGSLVMRIEDQEAQIRRGNEELVNKLKRAYSQVVVKETAEEFGLTFVSQTEDELEGELEWAY